MTKEATINAALTLAFEVLEDWGSPLALPAIIAIKEALAPTSTQCEKQPAQEPRNFCPRCGKRTADLTVIHTCTPPEGGHQ